MEVEYDEGQSLAFRDPAAVPTPGAYSAPAGDAGGARVIRSKSFGEVFIVQLHATSSSQTWLTNWEKTSHAGDLESRTLAYEGGDHVDLRRDHHPYAGSYRSPASSMSRNSAAAQHFRADDNVRRMCPVTKSTFSGVSGSSLSITSSQHLEASQRGVNWI